MAMISWFAQLENARTATAVVAIVRDYLALWSPEEIVLLPPDVRPGRLRDAADVADLHARLVEEYRKTRASGDALAALQRLTGFFARASVRIAQVGDAAPGDEAERPGAIDRARNRD
jgi:hypothetical protein